MRDLAFADHGLSQEDMVNALAKINYATGKDYAWEDTNKRFERDLKYDKEALRPHGLWNPDLYNNYSPKYRVADDAFAALGNIGGANYGNYGNYGGNFNNGSGGMSEYGGNNENARAIYTYLANKGLPDNVIAGIMGNMEHESGFNHDAFNPNDADGNPSGGIAQWHADRFNNLKNFAQQRGKDWKDLQT
jgi:hypothetical protein